MSSSPNTSPLRMEINGRPFYIKSKNNVPYIYDVDTHDEVGYWSSKKGAYVMFSLYNKIISDMKQKKCQQGQEREQEYSTSDSDSESHNGDGDERDDETSSDSSDSELEENDKQKKVEVTSSTDNTDANTDDANTNEKKSENTKYSFIMLFLVLFIYLTLQKELQSIYFDCVFLILINLLNTMKVFEIMNDE